MFRVKENDSLSAVSVVLPEYGQKYAKGYKNPKGRIKKVEIAPVVKYAKRALDGSDGAGNKLQAIRK